MGGRGAKSASGGIPPSNLTGAALQKDAFFGQVYHTSNQYMLFDQVTDKDNCIIMTNNLKVIKGNVVMVTSANTAIYLKDWQYRKMYSQETGEVFAVKLNRNFMKEYTFSSPFTEFSFDGEHDTFDSLWKTAASQQRKKKPWKSGGVTMVGKYGFIN